jgi:TRAP-type C4-dicarboxylate transport system permease small subunit
MFKKILKYNDLIVRETIIGLMIIMITFVFVQVLLRYITKNPLTWTDEASRFCLLWLVFLGCAVGVEKEQHLRVDSLPKLLKKRYRGILDSIVSIFSILFFIVILWEGVKITFAVADQRSPAMNISMGIFYGSLPVGAILMIWYSFLNLIEKVRPN